MITMKTINASDLAQRDAFFESLDKRTGETNQRVTETVSEIIRTVKTGGDEAVKNCLSTTKYREMSSTMR